MNKYILHTLLIGLSVLFSCSKKEQIAPDLSKITLPVEFVTPFSVSKSTPNFKTDSIYFTAAFKNETFWVITIKGNLSGAERVFARSDKDGLEISKANSLWDGSAYSVAAFRAESATATLSFPYSKTAPISIPLNIVGVK